MNKLGHRVHHLSIGALQELLLHHETLKNISQFIGVFNLYLFSLSFWVSTALANVGLSLVGVSVSYYIYKNIKDCIKDRIFIIFIALTVYTILQSTWLSIQSPGLDGKNWDGIWDFVSLWSFFGISWVIAGDEQRINKLLLCGLLGFMIKSLTAIYIEHDTSLINLIINTERINSNFLYGPNHTGKYALIIIYGLLIYNFNIFKKLNNKKIVFAWLLIFVATLITTITLIKVSQSRATALSSLILTPFIVYNILYKPIKSNNKFLIFFISIIVLLCITTVSFISTQKRIKAERNTIKKIALFNWKDIEYNSIGWRFHLARFAYDVWKDKPFIGYGAEFEAIENLAEEKGYVKLLSRSHLHSDYLTLLVRLGLAGSLFFLLGSYYVIKNIIINYYNNTISQELFLFLMGSLLIIWFCSLFQNRLTNVDFRFLWLLLAGIAYIQPKSSNIKQEI